jgi:YafQ family addiction module toxin component
MSYSYIIQKDCQKEIIKASKKNPVLRKALENKIFEIIQNPTHYKPLGNVLAGERRVHILKSFVLKFTVDENTKTVSFLAFDHHDNAYK